MRRPARLLLAALALTTAGIAPAPAGAAAGAFDWSYGPGAEGDAGPVTGQKPESKLWLAGGAWWGVLISPESGRQEIHRFDPAAGRWASTGTPVDPDRSAKGDALFDEAASKLYFVSRRGDRDDGNLLFRYTFSTAGYTLEPGFPVAVPGAGAEALTIAKDSTGTLWLGWIQDGGVLVSHSLGSHASWSAPAPIPGAARTADDDIAGVIAFSDAGGPKVGVLWSNQSEGAFRFAVHADGAPDGAWSVERAYGGAGRALADDHVNLKTTPDGRTWAAVKTSVPGGRSPLIVLLERSARGRWRSHVVATVSERWSRPLLAVDWPARLAYVVATVQARGSRPVGINYKWAPLDRPSFPAGAGSPLIVGPSREQVSNATSSKQLLSPATGLLVEGSDNGANSYWHGFAGLPAAAPRFTPAADAYADERSPSARRPRSRRLAVGRGRRAFVRFDVRVPPGHRVTAAVLRLRATTGSSPALRLHALRSRNWSERSVSWRRRPALGRMVAAVAAAPPGRWVELELSRVVRGSGVYAFGVRAGHRGSVTFASRETGGRAPQLILHTVPAG